MSAALPPVTPRPLGSSAACREAPRSPGVLTTRTGLVLPEDLGFSEWESAGHKLFGLVDSTQWALGDWLVHGMDHFRGRYQAAADAIGLDPQTLRNYAWLCRRFAHARRRPELSMQHHAEVASLPTAVQDEWLDRAVAGSWSRNALRREVRALRTASAAAGAESQIAPRLQVDAEELRRWQAAAERNRTDLGSWMVSTLRRAASGTALD